LNPAGEYRWQKCQEQNPGSDRGVHPESFKQFQEDTERDRQSQNNNQVLVDGIEPVYFVRVLHGRFEFS
jgi:hypothetical protein